MSVSRWLVKDVAHIYSGTLHACVLGHFSRVQFFVILWTIAHQVLLSVAFSRQEYWSGLPCPSPGDLPNPGIELTSLMSPTLAGRFFTTSATWEAPKKHTAEKYLVEWKDVQLLSLAPWFSIRVWNLPNILFWSLLPEHAKCIISCTTSRLMVLVLRTGL